MFKIGPMEHNRFMDIFIDVHRITPTRTGDLKIEYMCYNKGQGTTKPWLCYEYVLSAIVLTKDLKNWRPYVGPT